MPELSIASKVRPEERAMLKSAIVLRRRSSVPRSATDPMIGSWSHKNHTDRRWLRVGAMVGRERRVYGSFVVMMILMMSHTSQVHRVHHGPTP